MYGRVNGNGRAAFRMYQKQFPDRRMPEITEFFSGYVNSVKHMRATSLDMMLVEEELTATAGSDVVQSGRPISDDFSNI
ncbi:hypothetical protein TNCV_2970301 [Trichonephila clavipes]|nr:hypothetical protein TNCV_2970301 [Trichonephila clavipes]